MEKGSFLVSDCHMLTTGNKNKGKGNGAGLAWESQSHCFADEIVFNHAHFYGTDTKHDYSQGNCRTIAWITSSLLYTVIKLYSLHENLAYSVDLNI